MFEPIIQSGKWLLDHIPKSLRRPKFSFILWHYTYLISLTILASIILYPGGVMQYIDALFFAAGAATQSGLNTINVNDLRLYQQVVLILVSHIANPVFIHTSVVFVRLYWFEKRFQHIVREARSARRTRTMSMRKSTAVEDAELGKLEQGVNGREIKVLHDTTQPNGMNKTTVAGVPNGGDDQDMKTLKSSLGEKEGHVSEGKLESDTSSSAGQGDQTPVYFLGQNPALKRDITFADEVEPESKTRSDSTGTRMPRRLSTEHHIAFLEKQRQNDRMTLRIPGPRDFDRGDLPREIDSDDNELETAITRDSAFPRLARRASSGSQTEHLNEDDHPTKRGIAFDEPERPQREPQSQPQRQDWASTSGHITPLQKLRQKSDHAFHRTFSGLKDRSRTFSLSKSQERDMPHPMPYLSWQPTIGRNSAFYDLTEHQREELGGIEYRSLKTLAVILVTYFIGWHLFGVICLVPWMKLSKTWGPIAEEDGFNRVWWGIFTPASMFNDLGFTLTPDSMSSFQTAVLPLLLGSFLIIIGNTGFPCMLRFTIWLLSMMVPRGSGIWEELHFLLDHPRRCFTLLFPSKATWWLFWILFGLNALDLLFFIVLDLDDPVVTALAPGFRVLNGWFQAASTRTAGFACVNLADLHPAIQVSYLIMMYVSVFPIAISVRRTNVYEEKSLGIYAADQEEDDEGKSYVGQHLRRQLSFDLWYIFLGLFVIAIVEGSRLGNTKETAFTLFSVLFEIVSAYGTVGLSLGYPTNNTSFSAEFAVISKLIIIAMMLRGRHRGLPYALDRAILLPSESLHKKEAEEAARRSQRRPSLSVGQARTMDRESNLGGELNRAPTSPSQQGPEGLFRRSHSRRASELSIKSRTPTQGLGQRRLSTFIASGLSAGPTNVKHE